MNTSQTPPGGWQYYQPQTGWTAPSPVGFTHDQQVTNIIKHRLSNPAIVARFNLATNFDTVSSELIKFQQQRGALPADVLPKMTPPVLVPQMSGGVQASVAAVKKLASGAALLFEWETSGLPPEPIDVAEKRAALCVNCPKNDPEGLAKFFTDTVSENIRKRLGRLYSMNLTTIHSQRLHTCAGCLCPMKLKVFTPAELIKKRLTPQNRSDLNQENPRCWQLDL